jgi:hypothetical protein
MIKSIKILLSCIDKVHFSEREKNMKKGFICFLVFILVLSLLLINPQKNVLAEAGDIGSGVWVLPGSTATFTNVNVDEAAKSVPSWLQQLSEGIQIKVSNKICYPFRGGQFHWVPQIMKLTDGVWTRIATTQEYLYTTEVVQYACAAAPTTGTYALFGYYNGPTEPTCAYDTSKWSYDLYDGYFEVNFPSSFPTGVSVTYRIIGDYSSFLLADRTGTTTTYNDGGTYATFYDSANPDGDISGLTFLVTTQGCSVVVPYHGSFE